MSATIDTEKFQNYFKTNCADIDIYPPTLHILKESKFDNQLFYIDQLSSLGKVSFNVLCSGCSETTNSRQKVIPLNIFGFFYK